MEGVRPRAHGRPTVEFSVKGPVSIIIDEEQVTIPGCSILDINFKAPSEIGELLFRNYYTAWLTLLIKYDTQNNGVEPRVKDTSWRVSIMRKVLMLSPHNENSSNDVISIAASESTLNWRKVISMRLILRQPSSHWHVFHVEELNIYRDLPRFTPLNHTTTYIDSRISSGKFHKTLNHLYKTTVHSLYWRPPAQESKSDTVDSSTKLSEREQRKKINIVTCGYEIAKIPIS